MFKQKINLDRHSPEPYPNIWHFLDPPIFSLPTTFKGVFKYFFQNYNTIFAPRAISGTVFGKRSLLRESVPIYDIGTDSDLAFPKLFF
jgi:hypothetical protein